MHQLPWESSRFRTGDALVLGLRETVQKMLEKENG
jgi:hypothetical protein